MASKKINLLMFMLLCSFTITFAQTDLGWDWKDSSKVAVKNVPQYNEFLNNQYPYPAMPKSMWELGLGLGSAFLSDDLGANAGIGASFSLRKAINHTFSFRQYLSYYSSNGNGTDGAKKIDYKHNSWHVGTDILTSLNSLSFYRANPKSNVYLITGFDLFINRVKQSINGGAYAFYDPSNNRNLIIKDSKNAIGLGFNIGVGYAHKISDKVNIGFEAKNTLTNYDYLEGYSKTYSNAFDAWWYAGFRVNINLGNPAKKVQPLWWINPLNFAYSELNAPKHMKMPKVVLPDADGDGVTDQFDLEPNTPAGAPVDSKGVSKDTDGDGVPDYKDKELLTPQSCFPVNNDGIGSCPEPACCKELRSKVEELEKRPVVKPNPLPSLPPIQFKNKSSKLSDASIANLKEVAKKLKENPDSKIKLIGYGASSKASQQLSWERVNAVRKYLVEKMNIAENRIIFTYGLDGDPNTVDVVGTTEDGPSIVPAPHPNLKSKN